MLAFYSLLWFITLILCIFSTISPSFSRSSSQINKLYILSFLLLSMYLNHFIANDPSLETSYTNIHISLFHLIISHLMLEVVLCCS